jgi:Mg/Co/Ni transporter MgtE
MSVRPTRASILVGLFAAAAMVAPAPAADPAGDLSNLSPGQIQSAIQSLPPQIRQQILQQLQGKSTDELMRMSPDQLRSQVQNLSPDMKSQLKSQWASLSSDQKAAIKSLDVRALMQRIRAMTGPELAMIRKMVERALGGSADQN